MASPKSTDSYSFPLFRFLLLFLFFSSPVAQPYRNITLGSSLTAQNKDAFWSSPSGDFAFGFLQIGSGGFLLAIWFNKIPEKTVVWSANRNNLVLGGSRVQFTTNGQLVLNDPAGKQIWSANLVSNNGSVSYAAMLDNGNLVLAANNSNVLWQSFDEPTDTILPSQTLNMGRSLVARFSETNYSSGRFLFAMQGDGNLVFYPREFPMDSRGPAYWASNTVNFGFQVVFNLSSGSVYLIADNKTILTTLTSDTPSTQKFHHRAILEHDGVFRQYVYPKVNNGSDSAWPEAWSLVSNPTPSNICTRINDGAGSGACGFNSYCSLGTDQRPFCTCPPRYDVVDPNDVMKGCKPSFIPQSCDFSEIDAFEFSTLENVDWLFSAYQHFEPVSEDWCRNDCLGDCFCAAAIFRNGDCWKKKFPLTLGRMDPNAGGKALIKIRKFNSTLSPDDFVKKERNKTKIVIGSVLLSSSAFLNLILLLVTFLVVYRFKKKKPKILPGDTFFPDMNLRSFSYEELNKATNGFTEQLGSGAFATVYKGIIESMDINLVAVKKLHNMVSEGDKEFKAEVSAIARTNHKNLVQLRGFCNEGQHRMLVYEFMQNGSLADFLFGPSKPIWYRRIQVALGIARGLCYLHEECSTQIIHCDIKPQNILLDDSFAARISDFGLAKLLKKNQTRTVTAIRGTKGYVAPEWFRSLPITVKVDVYCFGILLLELICCRKNFEAEAENENEMVLADWACDCLRDKNVEVLVENDEEAKNDMKRVEKYVMIAVWCIQEEPSLRPTMKKVIQMLEGAVEVSVPPDPSSFISSIQ